MIYVVWGATFFAVSISLKSFQPFLLSALRMLLAGSVLCLICTIRHEPWPAFSDILKNALCGIVVFIGGILAVVWAQQYLSSSLASVIITTPFWFVVLDRRQWKFYFSSGWILAGLITGLIGVILLLGWKQGTTGVEDTSIQVMAILVIIIGSGLWVLGALFLKYNPPRTSPYVGTCIQFLSAGIVCVFIHSLSSEHMSTLSDIRIDSAVALFYLGVISSCFGFMSFLWLIKMYPPAIVSTYSYVNPVVAVLLGWGLNNENITSLQIFSLVIILTGVLFVNVPKYRESKARAA